MRRVKKANGDKPRASPRTRTRASATGRQYNRHHTTTRFAPFKDEPLSASLPRADESSPDFPLSSPPGAATLPCALARVQRGSLSGPARGPAWQTPTPAPRRGDPLPPIGFKPPVCNSPVLAARRHRIDRALFGQEGVLVVSRLRRARRRGFVYAPHPHALSGGPPAHTTSLTVSSLAMVLATVLLRLSSPTASGHQAYCVSLV